MTITESTDEFLRWQNSVGLVCPQPSKRLVRLNQSLDRPRVLISADLDEHLIYDEMKFKEGTAIVGTMILKPMARSVFKIIRYFLQSDKFKLWIKLCLIQVLYHRFIHGNAIKSFKKQVKTSVYVFSKYQLVHEQIIGFHYAMEWSWRCLTWIFVYFNLFFATNI